MIAVNMERKVLGVFALMFAGLLATAVLAYITTHRLVNTAGWVSHTYAVMDRLQATRTAALQAESAMRGFVITGDNNFLNTKDSALSDLATDYIQLRNMTSDNPVEQRHLDKLSRILGDWRTRVADVQLARQFTGFAAAQALVQARHIATRTAQVFLTLDAMHAEEQRLLDARLAEERHRDTIVDVVYALLCSLALIFFIGIYLQIRREIFERRQTEEKFHGLFESAPDAVILSDSGGQIVLVNAQTEKSFGYARGELIGQSIDMLIPERFHDRHHHHRAGYIAAPRTRMMDMGLELFARRKNGSEFPVDISLSPITTEDGVLVVSEIRDITQRQEVENQIRDLNKHLQQRAVELETVNQELEAFSYSVSHDLRAPLRAVDGFSRLLEQEYCERLDAEGLRLLTVVRDNSRKMGALIDDLLTFSRLGRKPVEEITFDMHSLVKEALSDALTGIETGQPEVEVKSLPNARADRALLKQVWLNLLSNAVKYSGKSTQPRITVGGRIDGDECVYHVQDNGVGFDMRYYDKLFGVFQRLHGPEQFPGTGVGLAIVKRVVVKHGGRVWAEGKPNEGASFFFSLPNKDLPT